MAWRRRIKMLASRKLEYNSVGYIVEYLEGEGLEDF